MAKIRPTILPYPIARTTPAHTPSRTSPIQSTLYSPSDTPARNPHTALSDIQFLEEAAQRALRIDQSETGESYVPYVVETSIGVDRMFLQVMSAAYTEEKLENGEERVVLRIPAALAPRRCL